ncbi:hypothetical protein [Streptomyces sp. NPDC059262]|uniref:hypothetical protein n=1 Tax=Streptomyces sp. NPDC059262 TaxID=3346797 RepID=UPI0036ACA035
MAEDARGLRKGTALLEQLIGYLVPAPVRTVERVDWRMEKWVVVSPRADGP